jgi:hypothetical protein
MLYPDMRKSNNIQSQRVCRSSLDDISMVDQTKTPFPELVAAVISSRTAVVGLTARRRRRLLYALTFAQHDPNRCARPWDLQHPSTLRRVASTITRAAATPIPTTGCARPSGLRRRSPGATALSARNEQFHSRGRVRRTCEALAMTDLGRAIAVDSDRCEQHAAGYGAASPFVAPAAESSARMPGRTGENSRRAGGAGTQWQERHRWL